MEDGIASDPNIWLSSGVVAGIFSSSISACIECTTFATVCILSSLMPQRHKVPKLKGAQSGDTGRQQQTNKSILVQQCEFRHLFNNTPTSKDTKHKSLLTLSKQRDFTHHCMVQRRFLLPKCLQPGVCQRGIEISPLFQIAFGLIPQEPAQVHHLLRQSLKLLPLCRAHLLMRCIHIGSRRWCHERAIMRVAGTTLYLTNQVHHVDNLGAKWSTLEVVSSWVKTSPC